jgi:hypothetical protein
MNEFSSLRIVHYGRLNVPDFCLHSHPVRIREFTTADLIERDGAKLEHLEVIHVVIFPLSCESQSTTKHSSHYTIAVLNNISVRHLYSLCDEGLRSRNFCHASELLLLLYY